MKNHLFGTALLVVTFFAGLQFGYEHGFDVAKEAAIKAISESSIEADRSRQHPSPSCQQNAEKEGRAVRLNSV